MPKKLEVRLVWLRRAATRIDRFEQDGLGADGHGVIGDGGHVVAGVQGIRRRDGSATLVAVFGLQLSMFDQSVPGVS
jgi:hypothetical protein